MKKIISIALAALFSATVSLSAQAAENPFGMSDLEQTAQLSMSTTDGKCGGDTKTEGKCGGDTKTESKCGGDTKTEGKCGGK